jgi:F-type H+-transporting ATPase subunit beta
LNDEFKDYPESALYMIGAVDEAKEKAKFAKPDPKDASESTSINNASSRTKLVTDSKPEVRPESHPKSMTKFGPKVDQETEKHES